MSVPTLGSSWLWYCLDSLNFPADITSSVKYKICLCSESGMKTVTVPFRGCLWGPVMEDWVLQGHPCLRCPLGNKCGPAVHQLGGDALRKLLQGQQNEGRIHQPGVRVGGVPCPPPHGQAHGGVGWQGQGLSGALPETGAAGFR